MSYRLHPTKNRKLPPNSKKYWYVTYYPEGKKGGPKNVLYFGNEDGARMVDAELRRGQKSLTTAINPTIEKITADFLVSYRVDHRAKGTSRTAISLEHIKKFFGKMTLTSITPQVVEQYKISRLDEGLTPSTIQKELCCLSSLLKWAVEKDLCEPFVWKVKKFPGKLVKAPVPVVPSMSDAERIITEVRPNVRGLAMLMLYAGLRRNEALNLRAEDVVLERRVIIPLGKGGKQRIVPIVHPDLIAELERKIEEVKTGILWQSPYKKDGAPYTDIKDSLKRAAKRAGISMRIYNHLLRHAFGTHAIESGIDLRSVQLLMGHSTSQVTETYTHVAAAHLQREMEKFNTVKNSEAAKAPKNEGAAGE